MSASSAPRLSTHAVEELLTEFQSGRGELDLDLCQWGSLERAAGGLLGAALLGSLGARPLHLRLDGSNSDWLTASGVAFALANRAGPTSIEGASLTDLRAAGWASDWRPGHGVGARVAAGGLFDPAELRETSILPDLSGLDFAAFVNPHLTRPRLQRHPLTTLLWPWLDGLVPRARRASVDRDQRSAWLSHVGQVIDETLGNVCEHAGAADPGGLRSLVQVVITRGGTRSANRLHIAVSDTGVGIPATARPKLARALAVALSEEQLVARLLEGTLAPWGRGRGQGLPRIVEICRRHKGVMRLATKTTRAVLESGRAGGAVRTSASAFRLDGTVLALTLPIPEL
jgi:hypothetical protein